MTQIDPPIAVDQLPLYALFALVVRHQSFSVAARKTGLARSAVSQRIARLEETVGAQLLRRTTRRVSPTEAGLKLYGAAAQLLEQAEALVHTFDGELMRGPLRVNAALNLVNACLGGLLARFASKLPEVQVELRVENRLVDLLETRDDVVVRVGHHLPPDVVARKLFDDRVVTVASPGYLAEHGTPTAPQQLVHHRALCYSPTPTDEEWRFESARKWLTVPVRPAFVADDGDVLRLMAVAGQGLAAMPTFMVAQDLRAGRLVQVLQDHRQIELHGWAILPAGRKATRRARTLVDFLGREVPGALPRPPAA